MANKEVVRIRKGQVRFLVEEGNKMIDFSRHVTVRAAQRNLNDSDINYVTTYGKKFHKAGALIYYLRKRDIPVWDRSDQELMRLVGTAVIMTMDGRQVITVWRNRIKGLKRIKRKLEYDAQPELWPALENC